LRTNLQVVEVLEDEEMDMTGVEHLFSSYQFSPKNC